MNLPKLVFTHTHFLTKCDLFDQVGRVPALDCLHSSSQSMLPQNSTCPTSKKERRGCYSSWGEKISVLVIERPRAKQREEMQNTKDDFGFWEMNVNWLDGVE